MRDLVDAEIVLANALENQRPVPNQSPHQVHEIRSGTIRAMLWRADTTNGPLFKASFERLDQEQLVHSRFFESSDLPELMKVAGLAQKWIQQQAT